MKKLVLTLAGAAFLALPSVASAQQTSGTINATATIPGFFTFGTNSPLDFGTLTPGTDKTVSTHQGGFIEARYNVPGVTVTISPLPSLSNGAGSSFTPNYTCGYGVANATTVTAFTTSCTTAQTFSGNTEGTVKTQYIYIGGTVPGSQTATLPTGSYSGTIQLTIAQAQ
jgi:hypothetical protein